MYNQTNGLRILRYGAGIQGPTLGILVGYTKSGLESYGNIESISY